MISNDWSKRMGVNHLLKFSCPSLSKDSCITISLSMHKSEITGKRIHRGLSVTQMSFQNNAFLPLFTCIFLPLKYMCVTLSRSDHTGEPVNLCFTEPTVSLCMYLALIRSCQIPFCVYSFHHHLVKRLIFIFLMLLMPNPPFFLLLQMVSHLTRWYFFLLTFFPPCQKKVLRCSSRMSVVVLGNK